MRLLTTLRRIAARSAVARPGPARPRLRAEPLEERVVLDGTFHKLFTTEHVDFAFDYLGGQWEVSTEIGSDNTGDPAIDYDPATVLHHVAPQARAVRPAGAQWDFLGTPAGQPVWILPAAQNPNVLYAGTAAEETIPGTFAAYNETDPRVTNSFPLPWVTAQVTAVRGPGQFSAWQTGSFGALNVFVSSAQGGLTATDKLFLVEGGHAHYNFGFSRPGFYEIDFQGTGYLGEGQTNPTTSPVTTFYFTVDDVLKVTSVTPTESGFVARFNRPIDVSVLNLYDVQGGTLGPADVTLVGPGGPVRGSLVIPSAAIPNESTGTPEQRDAINAVEFVRTGGPLPAGEYVVTLRSDNTTFAASKGFKTTTTPTVAGLLDGNGDGTTGDSFALAFTVAPSSARVVSVPDFARGYGQTVNAPAVGAGVPVTIDNAGGVTRAEFDLLYNPDLLSVTAATRGPAVPATFTVTLDASVPGRARVVLDGPAGLPAGPLTLVTLSATVPGGAAYADKHVLRLSGLELNSGAVLSRPDHGVHVAAYLGDADGNNAHNALDGTQSARVAAALDTGFAAYQLLDPVIVAGITGNGDVGPLDATRIAQKAAGLSVPAVPDLPAGVTPPAAGGPDPRLYFVAASGRPGETVTVQLRMFVSERDGIQLAAGDYAIRFDPTRFQASNVRAGSLVAGFGTAANVDNVAGTIRVAQFSASSLGFGYGTDGDVLLIDFTVRDDARPGRSALNLAEKVASNGSTTRTGLSSRGGPLTLIPAPTDAADDRKIDAVFTVLRRRAGRAADSSGTPADAAGEAAGTPSQVRIPLAPVLRRGGVTVGGLGSLWLPPAEDGESSRVTGRRRGV